MGLFNRKKPQEIKNNVTYSETSIDLSNGDFVRGIDPDEPLDNADKLSAVYKCRKLISDSIGKIPFFVFDEKTHQKVEDHYLNKLLQREPISGQNAFSFKKAIVLQILDNGNCYLLPKWNTYRKLEVQSIKIIQNVTPIINNEELIGYKITVNNNQEKNVKPEEIVHLKGSSKNGIIGESVLSSAQNTIAIAQAQSKFQKTFYKRGGVPTGTLEVPTDLSSKEYPVRQDDGTVKNMSGKQAIKEAWEKQTAQGTGTAVLDNGMKYNTVNQLSPKDMDFVSTQNLSILDIARFYCVPASKLNVGSSTYKSREQEAIEYISEAVQPYVDQMCIEFTNKLLSEEDKSKGFVVKADTDVEMFADATTRINYIKNAIQSGIMTPSEGRISEELGPAYEEGNQFVIGPNYLPVGSQGNTNNLVQQNDEKNDNYSEEEGGNE